MNNPMEWDDIENKLKQLDGRQDHLSAEDINYIEKQYNEVRQNGSVDDILRITHLLSFFIDSVAETYNMTEFATNVCMSAAKLTKENGLYVFAGHWFHVEGFRQHRLGIHGLSIKLMGEAVECFSLAKNHERRRESLFFSALSFRALGQLDTAYTIVSDTLDLVQDDPWRANPLEVLAWIERDRRNFVDAEDHLQEAIENYKQLGVHYQAHVAQAYADLAEIRGLQGYDDAFTYFAESLSILEGLPTPNYLLIVRSLIKKARYASVIGKSQDAHESIHEAITYARYLKNCDLLWRGYVVYAVIDIRALEFRKAVRHFLWALEYIRMTQRPLVSILRLIVG